VSENRVVRKIFGPNRDEVTGDCRKLHMGRVCTMNGEKWNAYRILVGKLEGKRPLGRPRRRWMANIKINLKRERMGWYGLD
jgi:hypothetical protein